MLTRMHLGLLAAALSVPLAARAAPNNAPIAVVMLPVAVPMPMRMPMPMPMKLIITPGSVASLPPMLSPAALLAPMLQMQAQLQASLADLSQGMPTLAALPAGAPGITRISMLMMGGPQGACAEQMQILPGANGHAQIFVRRFGPGCGPLPAAMGKLPAGRQAAPAQAYPGAARPMMGPMPMTAQPPAAGPHLPPNALPPPSLLTYADYPMATRHNAAPLSAEPAIAYRPVSQK
jgi:hypothetical protein